MPRLPWMSRADRRRWKSARTLADVGELTAPWLPGEISSLAGYAPRYRGHRPDHRMARNRQRRSDARQPAMRATRRSTTYLSGALRSNRVDSERHRSTDTEDT
jgi:hypothetical protein